MDLNTNNLNVLDYENNPDDYSLTYIKNNNYQFKPDFEIF